MMTHRPARQDQRDCYEGLQTDCRKLSIKTWPLPLNPSEELVDQWCDKLQELIKKAQDDTQENTTYSQDTPEKSVNQA